MANFVVSLAVITVLGAMLYRFLPDTEVPWRDVGIGAVSTALLFVISKFLCILTWYWDFFSVNDLIIYDTLWGGTRVSGVKGRRNVVHLPRSLG